VHDTLHSVGLKNEYLLIRIARNKQLLKIIISSSGLLRGVINFKTDVSGLSVDHILWASCQKI
jgi:hypothetical protein